MGLPGTCCVVCGAYFDHPYDIDIEDDVDYDPPIAKFMWLQKACIFGLRSSLPHFVHDTKGPDIRSDTTQEIPEFIDNIWYTQGDGTSFMSHEFGSLYTLGVDTNGDAIFGMHVTCAEIMRRVAKSKIRTPAYLKNKKIDKVKRWTRWNTGRPNASASLRAYYDALRKIATPWRGEYLNKDYYGATDYWGYDNWEDDNESFDGAKPYFYNPLFTYSLTDSIAASLKPAKKTQTPPSYPPSTPSSKIESLPTELLHTITNQIPILSALNLRLCSKTLAARLPLDQRFFREALINGNLTPYLWDKHPGLGLQMQQKVPDGADPEGYWDWKEMACRLSDLKGLVLDWVEFPAPDGFWNRCRIWLLVEEQM